MSQPLQRQRGFRPRRLRSLGRQGCQLASSMEAGYRAPVKVSLEASLEKEAAGALASDQMK